LSVWYRINGTFNKTPALTVVAEALWRVPHRICDIVTWYEGDEVRWKVGKYRARITNCFPPVSKTLTVVEDIIVLWMESMFLKAVWHCLVGARWVWQWPRRADCSYAWR
jgi:hypothetical protein